MNDVFQSCDDLGPKSVFHFHEQKTDLKGILVVDNVAAGPAIGGARFAPDVTLEECRRLARAMTFKNAAAGLPHGGAKSVVFFDPVTDGPRKEEIVRAFARMLEPIADYIVGPDMGVDETEMGWIHDEIGRAVGLPREIGGIPLDEIGATGFGLVAAAEIAEPFSGVALDGARVAVQGFGAVGMHAARFLRDKGSVLVAAADSRGTVADPQGLDPDRLIAVKTEGGALLDAGVGKHLETDAVVGIDCDIWISAARPDVIRKDNVDQVRAKLILQGANIGVTDEAERVLHARGVVSIPDFIANAGGVICASVEYHGGNQTQAFQVIDEKIRRNTAEVLARSQKEGILPRTAAVRMAEDRVRRAMALRRWN